MPFPHRIELAGGGMIWILVAVLTLGLAGCQIGSDRAEPDRAAALLTPEVLVQTLDATPGAGRVQAAPVSDALDETVTEAGDAGAGPSVVEKTAAHLACEKLGGFYVVVGDSGPSSCQFRTRDGGKSCRSSAECEGVCLARSRSCAPVNPLFGCNDVLQDDGRRVSLCIE